MQTTEDSSAKRTRDERDWTRGNILHNLLSLSWPIILSMSLYTVGGTVEMICVGRLGADAIAGVAVSGMVFMLAFGTIMGFVTGVRALIARSVGAGDIEEAQHIARQGFILIGVCGVAFAVLGTIFAEPLLRLFGLAPGVIAAGALYLRIYAPISVPACLWVLEEGIMQASGDVATPLKMAFASKVLHVSLIPSLVFGWWVFPELGVRGAAIAVVLAECVGMSLGLWFLFRGGTRLKLTLSGFKINPKTIWRIVRIGLPASLMSFQGQFGSAMLMRLIAPFGTLAVAAHSLGARVEMVLFMPAWGLGGAAGVLVGQNLGAGEPARAEKSAWTALAILQGFMVICSIIILLWAEGIIRVFSSDPAVVELSGTFLRIAVAGYSVWGLTAILANCLNGAGDTLPPLLVNLLMIWIIQVPLAYLLPRVTDLGVYSVRWAIVAGVIIAAATYLAYFRAGRWKRKVV